MQTFRSYRVVDRHDPEDVSSAPERAKSAKLQLLIPAILKLSFFLVLLPFWLTLRHFKYVSSQTNALIVSSASGTIPAGFEAYYGLYRQVNAQYFQFSMPSPSYWPSLVEIATTVAKPHPPSSTLHPDKKKNFQGHVIYWKENRWCLSGNYCSRYAKNVADKSRPPLPPPGSWSSQNKQVSVHVTTLRRGGRRFSNRNLEYIVTHPSTTLLLSLLVGLAFYYWNNRVPPERVAKTVSGIIQRKEYYRAFSGATAHFEAVHLGFNLMALHSLGTDLEPLYGSVSFLLYNVSLIPITTVIMMGLFEIRKRRFGDTSDHSSVGYSGVLFAWMVVSSLERDVVCPIPLFHKVCFHTFQISNTIKINMGPIIQLAVAQVLLKRASFVGHLAGIVAGFLLHWRLLPLELVQPCVLIPALLLALQPRPVGDGVVERDWRLWNLLVAFIAVTFIIGYHWSLVLPMVLETWLLYNSLKTGLGWRDVAIACILTILTDSMTLAAWLVYQDLYGTDQFGYITMLGRIGLQGLVLSLACKSRQQDDDDAAFRTVLTTSVNSATNLGEILFESKEEQSTNVDRKGRTAFHLDSLSESAV